ncbi:tetratricopeptide repeat protein 14 isoform X3 [Archocentrus centrarchus]|uniref:tetratricopeptide repeat protein 14 isoform X3 n=1 Tax=Archocentrus centrarchus TaxID=63155 RepID=UPI0011EA4D05|nr:tetratricopeptide repeat protein 14 isoform X3 [Archocentrus centrarchus]
MDRDLLKQCLTYHGQSLFNTLKCEQTENPDFQAVVSDLCKATYESRSEENSNELLVEQFIARKADILFSPAWKTAALRGEDHEEEEAVEPYAVMPPMELFMEVPYEERRSMIYRDLERGDIVVGRINNIREYGFFLTLFCTAGGLKRDIEDLELSALCHVREIPSTGSHDDPLSYYQIGDFIRAGVKDIDRYQEKITVSLYQACLSPSLEHIKLGVITREELPIHYSRSVRAASDSSETYQHILTGCHGYHNPSVVDYLLEKVGISDTQPPSMMRGLQSKLFQEEDFASAIRKKQSASWALKCVRAGVDHFKHGRHVEAMNEYNKALEIDTNNVEALVARGALYANKGSIMKAITDFEQALENCPDHRNARKYLCQTLVERGKQLEEQEKLVTAEGLYRRALALDDSNPEAQEALHKITDTIQEALAKEQVTTTSSQSSAEKLRKILKEEKRMKKKQKRSASSSSSSSTSSRTSSSSSSSSSSRRRSKKKKKKRRKSECGSKRHRRISSRESRRSNEGKKDRKEKEEDEVEWYPAPSNTSATFLNQLGGLGFGVRDEEQVEGKDGDDRKNFKLYSLSAASEEEESDSSRRERKRKDREESRTRKTKNSWSRSPDREKRRSRSRERRDRSRDVDRKKDRRESDSKRRSSLDENHKRKLSCSSGELEYSRKSSFRSEHSGNSNSKHPQNRMRHDSSARNFFEGDRCENRGRLEAREVDEVKREKESRKEGGSMPDQGHSKKESAGTHNEESDMRRKKDLPANLLDIFNQIAQFEKDKGVKPKK